MSPQLVRAKNEYFFLGREQEKGGKYLPPFSPFNELYWFIEILQLVHRYE